jgi:hypothetical protein
VIGIEAGCFAGQTNCVGQVTMSHDGTVVAQRSFNIAPESGGFQNVALNQQGRQLLRSNGPFHLLAVTVTVVSTNGQAISQVMHLARWVWR